MSVASKEQSVVDAVPKRLAHVRYGPGKETDLVASSRQTRHVHFAGTTEAHAMRGDVHVICCTR